MNSIEFDSFSAIKYLIESIWTKKIMPELKGRLQSNSRLKLFKDFETLKLAFG